VDAHPPRRLAWRGPRRPASPNVAKQPSSGTTSTRTDRRPLITSEQRNRRRVHAAADPKKGRHHHDRRPVQFIPTPPRHRADSPIMGTICTVHRHRETAAASSARDCGPTRAASRCPDRTSSTGPRCAVPPSSWASRPLLTHTGTGARTRADTRALTRATTTLKFSHSGPGAISPDPGARWRPLQRLSDATAQRLTGWGRRRAAPLR